MYARGRSASNLLQCKRMSESDGQNFLHSLIQLNMTESGTTTRNGPLSFFTNFRCAMNAIVCSVLPACIACGYCVTYYHYYHFYYYRH